MTAYGITDKVSVDNLPIAQAGITAARTFVSASVSDVLLVAANSSRIGLIVYNDSNSPLFIGLGTSTVTTDNFTLVISAHTERGWEYRFNGDIRGAWSIATGVARITEIT